MNLMHILGAEGPNTFWLPGATNEIYWGTIAFFVMAFLLVKFARKPFLDYFHRRSEVVADQLGEAEEARVAAEAERDRIKSALADSDTEAARIIEDARRTADALTADIAARADADVAALRERASIDLAATRAQAQADLAGELSRLALGAAEEVVTSSLDADSQQRLIDDYIRQVGTQN
jgi:F-type H+-transporting ATPase subunit b